MRFALAALLLAVTGCPMTGSGGECQVDRDCTDQICARDGLCHAPSDVRQVKVTWTLRGQPATAMTCATSPDLAIVFTGFERGERLGYAPVPCMTGQFVIDKLPRSFDRVELGRDRGATFVEGIDASGTVAIDLQL